MFAAARRTHIIFLNKRAQKFYNQNRKLLESWLIFRRNLTWFMMPGLFFLMKLPVTIAENLFPQNPNILSSGFPQISLLECEWWLMPGDPCRSVGVTALSKASHFFPSNYCWQGRGHWGGHKDELPDAGNLRSLLTDWWKEKQNCCTKTISFLHHMRRSPREEHQLKQMPAWYTLQKMVCSVSSSAAPSLPQMVQWYTAGRVTRRHQYIERLTRKIIVK